MLMKRKGDRVMKESKTSIAFTGDIGFDKYMDRRWEDAHLLSSGVLDFFCSADHVCANVEGALIDAKDDGSLGVLFHSMNPAATCVLEKIQADIWSIGNNHIMDAGEEGVISTRAIAEGLGCKTFGAGRNLAEASRPLYLAEAGGIGMIGVSYMVGCVPATETKPGILRWDDMDTIAKRIAEIKEKCHWCVVVAHGGEEFASLPPPYTRERYLKYLELGADLVVGHHPHVPENYELLPDGKAVFYSLGNFIFDTEYQRKHLYTDTGVLLKLIFTEESWDFEAVGIQICRKTERVDVAPLPDVFVNIPEAEYHLLAPLSAKAFLEEDKRIMRYLEPERFVGCSDAVWEHYFTKEISSYYSENAHMDYGVIVPLAQKAEDNCWQQSKLDKVKKYILAQL